MASGIPARLTAAEGRKFGLTVGGAFAVLTLVLWWRGRETGLLVTGALTAFFVLGGLLFPRSMGPVQRAWMGLALAISKVTTPIFLGVVFFVVIAPVGWIMRRFGRDPLAATDSPSAWRTREPGKRKSALNHQF